MQRDLGTVMASWRQRSAQTAAAAAADAAAADAAAALKHFFVIQSFPSESGDLQNTEGSSAPRDEGVRVTGGYYSLVHIWYSDYID